MDFSRLMSLSLLNNGGMDLFLDRLSAHLDTKAEPAYKSGKTMLAEALTGRMRADEAVMRQGARNAGEGVKIAEIASSAAKSLNETLTEMLSLQGGIDEAKFRSLAEKATTILENAKYNGISLFDGSKWASDNRLSMSADGQKAFLSLQFGYRESEFALANLEKVKEYATKQLADVDWGALQEDIKTTSFLTDSYDKLAKAYGGESDHMNNLADLYASSKDNALDFGLERQISGKGSIFSSSS